MGSRDGAAPCNFATANKGPLPHAFDDYTDSRSRSTGSTSTTRRGSRSRDAPPKLHHFALTPEHVRSAPGSSTRRARARPSMPISFTPRSTRGSRQHVTERASRWTSRTRPPRRSVHERRRARRAKRHDSGSDPYYTGRSRSIPNEVTRRPDRVAGLHAGRADVLPGRLATDERPDRRRRRRTTARAAPVRSGTFLGETVSGGGNCSTPPTWRIRSSRPRCSSASCSNGDSPMQNSYPAGGPDTGAFTIAFTHIGDRPGRTSSSSATRCRARGNRSTGDLLRQQPGNGASALEQCDPQRLPECRSRVNQRGDSCIAGPARSPSGPWDCVSIEHGQPDRRPAGARGSLPCSMPNNWIDGVSPATSATATSAARTSS